MANKKDTFLVRWDSSTYYQTLLEGLYKLGRQVVDECVALYDADAAWHESHRMEELYKANGRKNRAKRKWSKSLFVQNEKGPNGRPGKITHQLRNSIAAGIYRNGVCEYTYHPQKDGGSKPKKWNGQELDGITEAERVLMGYKPQSRIALVIVAAMPYRKYLERGDMTVPGSLREGYKIISDMAEIVKACESWRKGICYDKKKQMFKYGQNLGQYKNIQGRLTIKFGKLK